MWHAKMVPGASYSNRSMIRLKQVLRQLPSANSHELATVWRVSVDDGGGPTCRRPGGIRWPGATEKGRTTKNPTIGRLLHLALQLGPLAGEHRQEARRICQCVVEVPQEAPARARRRRRGDGEGDGEGDGDEKAWTWVEGSYLLRITKGIASQGGGDGDLRPRSNVYRLITDELPGRDADAVLRRVSELQLGTFPRPRGTPRPRGQSCLLCCVRSWCDAQAAPLGVRCLFSGFVGVACFSSLN